MVTFTAHLSVNIKRLTRYKQKVVLAAMLEGKSMPSNTSANTNFGCKIIFMCSVNFLHQQDSNSLFNGSIGHLIQNQALICLNPRFLL